MKYSHGISVCPFKWQFFSKAENRTLKTNKLWYSLDRCSREDLEVGKMCSCVLQAAICRCSQPLSGFSARCLEDEQMLQAIREANPGCAFMYVVDTRPKVSSLGSWLLLKLASQLAIVFPINSFTALLMLSHPALG